MMSRRKISNIFKPLAGSNSAIKDFEGYLKGLSGTTSECVSVAILSCSELLQSLDSIQKRCARWAQLDSIDTTNIAEVCTTPDSRICLASIECKRVQVCKTAIRYLNSLHDELITTAKHLKSQVTSAGMQHVSDTLIRNGSSSLLRRRDSLAEALQLLETQFRQQLAPLDVERRTILCQKHATQAEIDDVKRREQNLLQQYLPEKARLEQSIQLITDRIAQQDADDATVQREVLANLRDVVQQVDTIADYIDTLKHMISQSIESATQRAHRAQRHLCMQESDAQHIQEQCLTRYKMHMGSTKHDRNRKVLQCDLDMSQLLLLVVLVRQRRAEQVLSLLCPADRTSTSSRDQRMRMYEEMLKEEQQLQEIVKLSESTGVAVDPTLTNPGWAWDPHLCVAGEEDLDVGDLRSGKGPSSDPKRCQTSRSGRSQSANGSADTRYGIRGDGGGPGSNGSSVIVPNAHYGSPSPSSAVATPAALPHSQRDRIALPTGLTRLHAPSTDSRIAYNSVTAVSRGRSDSGASPAICTSRRNHHAAATPAHRDSDATHGCGGSCGGDTSSSSSCNSNKLPLGGQSNNLAPSPRGSCIAYFQGPGSSSMSSRTVLNVVHEDSNEGQGTPTVYENPMFSFISTPDVADTTNDRISTASAAVASMAIGTANTGPSTAPVQSRLQALRVEADDHAKASSFTFSNPTSSSPSSVASGNAAEVSPGVLRPTSSNASSFLKLGLPPAAASPVPDAESHNGHGNAPKDKVVAGLGRGLNIGKSVFSGQLSNNPNAARSVIHLQSMHG